MANKRGLSLHKERAGGYGHVPGDVNDVSVVHAPLGLNSNRIPMKFISFSNITCSHCLLDYALALYTGHWDQEGELGGALKGVM